MGNSIIIREEDPQMAKVYFSSFRCNSRENIFSKTRKLLQNAGLENVVGKDELVAIKTHFGEYGNLAYVPAQVLKVVADNVRQQGAKPFITDSNTLYRGSRSNAADHLDNAHLNGFLPSIAGAPVIIADGLKGNDYKTITSGSRHFKEIKIASAIYDADSVIVVSHVKGHELYGLGGALKNVAMGCAPRSGKQMLHSDMHPRVDESKCTSCGMCIRRCPADAISFNQDRKAFIDESLCISCGECTVICACDAIPVIWTTDHKPLHERTAEYVKGIMETKPGKWIFINYIMDVSPQCDCYYWNDMPIVPNIGILAARDPVAVDLASAELINNAVPLPGSKIFDKAPGKDNLMKLYDLPWKYLLEYAREIGIGETEYELESV